MTELGRRLNVRQVVISTAIIYFKRFYVKNSYRSVEPMLVLTACMYLASKIEEFPLHIKTVTAETRGLKMNRFTYNSQEVAEMEFYLLEELNFNMIVFHPYRSLIQISKAFGTKHEDVKMASYIINDTYRTDLFVTRRNSRKSIKNEEINNINNGNNYKDIKDIKKWFSELNVDMEQVVEIVQELIVLYDFWSEYDEDKSYSEIDGILKKLLIK
ncbi:3111_t:CDS:2 [Entrophospora sp. SA101]|nr:8447_t:CDS:2 [Entrophospora sp. SA101]CAJ0825588.1 9880_t:CDS:2 [Entrophospora sp. SA101]CAJ0840392.1 3111_t:CDS:2 [Entrophospora sp. SA101]